MFYSPTQNHSRKVWIRTCICVHIMSIRPRPASNSGLCSLCAHYTCGSGCLITTPCVTRGLCSLCVMTIIWWLYACRCDEVHLHTCAESPGDTKLTSRSVSQFTRMPASLFAIKHPRDNISRTVPQFIVGVCKQFASTTQPSSGTPFGARPSVWYRTAGVWLNDSNVVDPTGDMLHIGDAHWTERAGVSRTHIRIVIYTSI